MPSPSNSANPINRPNALRVLDEQFLEIRAKLIEIAANLDRIDRAENADDLSDDVRMQQIRRAIEQLLESGSGRAEQLQLIFSLPYEEKTV